MCDLRDAIASLAEIARRLHLNVTLAEIPRDELLLQLKDMDLPPDILGWYELGAPMQFVIPWAAQDLTLYAPTTLASRQGRYRTYGGGQRPEDVWPKTWIAIGDFAVNPITINTARSDTAIFASWHDIYMEPRLISPSVLCFLEMLAVYLDVRMVQFSNQIVNRDCELLPEFRAVLTENFRRLLTDECITNIWEFLG
jgi:hypothetical protein